MVFQLSSATISHLGEGRRDGTPSKEDNIPGADTKHDGQTEPGVERHENQHDEISPGKLYHVQHCLKNGVSPRPSEQKKKKGFPRLKVCSDAAAWHVWQNG